MAFQPWILFFSYSDATNDISFNWAMAFQPWIHVRGHYHCNGCLTLQLGHGFSAMDTPKTGGRAGFDYSASIGPWLFSHGYLLEFRNRRHSIHASIGPWLFSHGYVLNDECAAHGQNSFNWAMAFQPWIPHSCDEVDPDEVAASIGPWLFSHGYHHCKRTLCQSLLKLQLGHGFSAMDTLLLVFGNRPLLYRFNWAMAFQPWIRASLYLFVLLLDCASIGPWLFSHGYIEAGRDGWIEYSSFNWAMAFQPWIHKKRLRYQ